MTKKELFVVTKTSELTRESFIIALATKHEDAQKLYGKSIEKGFISEVYKVETGVLDVNLLKAENLLFTNQK